MFLVNLLETTLETMGDVAPIILVVFFFQAVALRRPVPHLRRTLFGFIYVLMLGAPWMVRQRAHVFIELVTASVGPRTRAALSRTVAAVSFLVCLVLGYYCGLLAWEDYSWGRYDELRGQLDIPRWVVTIALPVGFGLMAIEFLRFVFSAAPMHGARRQLQD